MNKKHVLWAIPAALLVLAFASCKDDPAPDPAGQFISENGSKLATGGTPIEAGAVSGFDVSGLGGIADGDYIALWGALAASMSDVNALIAEEGWTVTTVSDGSKWVSGATAVTILNYCGTNLSFFDGGSAKNSNYSTLLSTTGADGVYLPKGLSDVLKGQTVPVAGVFSATVQGESFIVVFFCTQYSE
jgi:hypothetical protein